MISRGLNLLRTTCINRPKHIVAKQFVRSEHHTFHYRSHPPEDKVWIFRAELCGGFLWWWVLWHFWHDFGHIVGEFPYPDASKWTDEELGIPPDDFDD